jgi:hypothetical protein
MLLLLLLLHFQQLLLLLLVVVVHCGQLLPPMPLPSTAAAADCNPAWGAQQR